MWLASALWHVLPLATGTVVDPGIILQIFQSAGAGTAIMVVLILLGILHPKAYTQRVEQEAEQWRHAYETERNARAEVEKALATERRRADAAVETAKVTAEILEGLRRRSNAPSGSDAASPPR